MNDTPPEQGLHEAEPTLPQEPTVLAAEVPPTRLLRPFSAFRHRNYQLFFSGQLISLIGTWLQSVSQGYLVYELTNSKYLLGAVGFLGSLPVPILCLFAGVIADRVNKRNLIMVTQTCAMILAFVLASLVKSHVVTVYHIMGVAVCLGMVQAFDIPTRQSFVIEMVGEEDLSNAIALNSVTFNIARILGPSVAGVVIAQFGIEMAFFLNGCSFVPVILGLGMMRMPPVVRRQHEPMMHQLVEGFRFIRDNEAVKSLLILSAVIGFFVMPYAMLMPVFAKDILNAGARGLGYLVSAIGAGALIGAAVLSSLGNFKSKSRLLLAGNFTFCVMLTLFSFSRALPLSMALLVGVGWGVMTNMALTNTIIQTAVPDDLRGRVMSVYVFFNMGMVPFGSLQAGLVAQHLGAPWVLRIGAIVCIAVALALSSRIIRGDQADAVPSLAQ